MSFPSEDLRADPLKAMSFSSFPLVFLRCLACTLNPQPGYAGLRLPTAYPPFHLLFSWCCTHLCKQALGFC